ncbi:MAG TPA: hypothetical protein VFP13_04655 [Actinomycetota bacterium]|nr:hypothetical protein [Actinomycetota bacterium]
MMPMRRYLVVANQTLAGEPLVSRIRELSRAGPCSFFLIVPATPPRDHPWTEGEARASARARLDGALVRLSGLEITVEGEVGDGNPMLAIDDAIRDHGPFEEIILSTLPPGASKWLRLDLPHRVAGSFGIPVTHVVGELAHVGASRR